MHLKLDELINARANANNDLISAADDAEQELNDLKKKYEVLSTEHIILQEHLSHAKDNGALPPRRRPRPERRPLTAHT